MSSEVKSGEVVSSVVPQSGVENLGIPESGEDLLTPVSEISVIKTFEPVAEVVVEINKINTGSVIVSEGPVSVEDLVSTKVVYQSKRTNIVEGIEDFRPEMYKRPTNKGMKESRMKEKKRQRREEKREVKKARNGTKNGEGS